MDFDSKKLLVVSNHRLAENQIKDLKALRIKRIIYPDEDIQKFWSNIPTEGSLDRLSLKRIIDWIKTESEAEDFILVQGEFGSTFYIVDFCLKHNRRAIYATSLRLYSEKKLEGDVIQRQHFSKHSAFREYINYE